MAHHKSSSHTRGARASSATRIDLAHRAQSMKAAMPQQPANETSDEISRIANLTETLAEFALLNCDTKARSLAIDLDDVLKEFIAAERPMRVGIQHRIESRVHEIRNSARRGNLLRVAFAATELYRLAYREIPRDFQEEPAKAMHLGYCRLKLEVLARRSPADWVAIEAIAIEAIVTCDVLSAVLVDLRLRCLLNRV